MNKAKNRKIFCGKEIFENIKVGKKDTGIKTKFNSSNIIVRKNYKLMKGISYGNDLNYQRYMDYLDKIREKEEKEFKEQLKKKLKKDKNELNQELLLSKKISFTEFENKYKMNSFLLQYLDYYDIQKINRKVVERNIKTAKNKRSLLKIDSEFNNDSDIDEEKNNNLNNSKIYINKTETNFNNVYDNLINKKIVKQISYNNKSQKRFKNYIYQELILIYLIKYHQKLLK